MIEKIKKILKWIIDKIGNDKLEWPS